MGNPLQPAVVDVLEKEFDAVVINLVSGSKAGYSDIIACIKGKFYGFEVKWRNDTPKELQKTRINQIIDAGGSAYFIRSVQQVRDILTNNIGPVRYEREIKFKL